MKRKYWNRARRRVHVTLCPRCGAPVETQRTRWTERDMGLMDRLCFDCEEREREERERCADCWIGVPDSWDCAEFGPKDCPKRRRDS